MNDELEELAGDRPFNIYRAVGRRHGYRGYSLRLALPKPFYGTEVIAKGKTIQEVVVKSVLKLRKRRGG